MKSDVWVYTIKFISNLLITGIVGLVDQLEDRLLCKQEVARSNRAQSTHLFINTVRGIDNNLLFGENITSPTLSRG